MTLNPAIQKMVANAKAKAEAHLASLSPRDQAMAAIASRLAEARLFPGRTDDYDLAALTLHELESLAGGTIFHDEEIDLNHLPARAKLETMGQNERWQILARLARETKADIRRMENGKRKGLPGSLEAAHKRLSKIATEAGYFGDPVDA